MAKENKSTRTDEKKSSPKTNLKDMIKQSVQPEPKAVTPPQKRSKKKNNKKSS